MAAGLALFGDPLPEGGGVLARVEVKPEDLRLVAYELLIDR